MKILKIIFLFFLLPLSAYDDRPGCYKDLERNFFNDQIVTTAFGLWTVPKGSWRSILRRLKEGEVNAESIIEKKSKRYSVNPLQNPFQPDVAKALLKETMKQIFIRAMVDSGYFDPASMDKMFDFIWEQDPRIQKCLSEAPTAQAPRS
ncbi:MAG: hypothetical protein KDK62_03655 [Chlamydiia bacterium]|nr:hypothetical protein [Chlamydiia bacterium]